MITFRRLRTLAPAMIGALGLTVCAVAVHAQDQGAPPPAGADGDHHRWDPAAMKQHWEARRAEHAKTLHDALGIRPEQEAAWQAFQAASMGGHGDHMGGHRGGGDHMRGPGGEHGGEAMTTPERLDRMAKRMDEHQAKFHQRAEAVKQFYAALSPTQQRTFDALAKLGHHGGRGGMGGGGMKPPGGGEG
jgi:protein CpxP